MTTKFLMTIVVAVILLLPVSYSQELSTVGGFLTDYEAAWEKTIDYSPTYAFAGKDYFGTFVKNQADSFYHHYSNEGELLWSSEALGYAPEWAIISESGNRVLLGRETSRDTDHTYFVSEVYDQDGNHLFSCPFHRVFYSSPNGFYFYSKWSYDGLTALTVLDSNGNVMPVGKMSCWDVRPIDDSLLVYNTSRKVVILNVHTGAVEKEVEIEAATGLVKHYFHLDRSGSKEYIALLGGFQLYVLNRNLENVWNYQGEAYLTQVSFLSQKPIVAFVEKFFPKKIGGEYVGEYRVLATFATLQSDALYQAEIKLPSPEKVGGAEEAREENQIGTSFCDRFFMYRFFSRRFLDSGRNRIYSGRSLVVRLLPDLSGIESQAVVESRLYHVRANNFLEIGNNNIRMWVSKGGE